jgi:phosphohistidine phosphatase SixA
MFTNLIMRIDKFLLISMLFTIFPANSTETSKEAIIEMLRHGGYVLYVRHGVTNHEQSDSDLSDLNNCQTQRNLSAQGKTESAELGKAIQQAGIKLSTVLSSPYCRCVDTAQTAFGQVDIAPSLRATFNENEQTTKQLLVYLGKQLTEVPPEGTNSVLVSHSANLREVTGIWPKPEGVVHIFKPNGQSYQHIGKILPEQWREYLHENKVN